MKTTYIQPEMTVVRLQHQGLICTSPGGYDGQSISIQSGSINDEGGVWTKEETGSSGVWDEEW